MEDRILFITKLYPTNSNPHAGRFIKNFVEELSKHVHVDVLILNTNKTPFKLYNKDTVYQTSLIPNPSGNIVTAPIVSHINRFCIKYICYKFKNTYTSIYSHFFTAAQYGDVMSNYLNIPHFIGIGENYNYLLSLNKIYSKSYVENILVNSKKIFCVSQANVNYLNDIYNLRRKTFFLPNGINFDVFNPENKFTDEFLFKLKSENDFVISFIGHFNERKGVYRLLEAVENIPNCKLVIIGKGKPINNKNIFFQGTLEPNLVAKWLNTSDVFVLPTQAEGWCNAINEAMACGLPIISSDIPSVKEQLMDTKYIKVNPNSIDQIREAIYTLKNNKKLRQEMGLSSKKRALKFDITNRAKIFLNEI